MSNNKSILIKAIKKENNNFDIFYKTNLICVDAENFSVFEDKILAISKSNYLFVYIIDKNSLKLYSALRKDGNFQDALIFIDETRYTVSFKCKITCYGRC